MVERQSKCVYSAAEGCRCNPPCRFSPFSRVAGHAQTSMVTYWIYSTSLQLCSAWRCTASAGYALLRLMPLVARGTARVPVMCSRSGSIGTLQAKTRSACCCSAWIPPTRCSRCVLALGEVAVSTALSARALCPPQGNFQELARRQLDLPPTPSSWAEASREMGRLLSPASGNVDVQSASPRAAGASGPTSPAAASYAQTRLLRRMSASSAAAGTPRSRSTSPASSYRNSAYSPRIADFQPVTQSSDPVLQHATATISSSSPGVLPNSSTVPISPTKRPSKLSNVVDLPLPVSDIKRRQPPAVFSQVDLLDDSDNDSDDDEGGPIVVHDPLDPYASRGRTLAMSGLQVDTAPMSRRSSSTPRSGSLPIPPQTVQTFLPPRMSHRGSFAVGQSLRSDYGSSDALPSRRISKPVKLPDEPVANVHKHVTSPFDYPKGAPQENALVLSGPSNARVRSADFRDFQCSMGLIQLHNVLCIDTGACG